MANRGRATFAKRQKEIARQERARDKSARRDDRKETQVKVDRAGGEDPDLVGIVPGPQALPYEILDGDLDFADDKSEDENEDSGEKTS
jgi:hypothetical protein